MLTERQDRILKIIVEDYVKTIRPISSSKINKLINCSSATIRNEMAHLEELGLLEKDHFASGRTPSEAGYKYYVANLMKPKDMTGDDMLKLQTIFKNNSLALSDTIRKSIAIVSEITNYTSIVLGTDAKENKLKKVEVIPLEDAKILTMVITDKGVVEHKNLYLPSAISLEDVTKTVFGNPVTRFLPFTSNFSISARGYVVPILIFISSAVRSPISKLCFFLI